MPCACPGSGVPLPHLLPAARRLWPLPTPPCKVTYIPLSEGEVRAVMEQQRLPVTARTAGDGALPPLALRLLHSGLLLVKVQRAEGIPSGGLFKPYVKLVLRVGRRQAETDATQASRQGAADFSRAAALHLEPEALQSGDAQGGPHGGAGGLLKIEGWAPCTAHALHGWNACPPTTPSTLHPAAPSPPCAVELELLQHNWRGGVSSCGRLALPLGPLLGGERLAGERRLEGGGIPPVRLQLQASFRPYF